MTHAQQGPAGTELPCPLCGVRIGRRRASCRECNRFAQAVHRAASRGLRAENPEAYAAHYAAAERDEYARVSGGVGHE